MNMIKQGDSKPKKVVALNTVSVEYYGSISAQEEIYITYWRKEGYAKGDILLANFKKGKFSGIHQLDFNFNNNFLNSSPAISPKGDWLIFYDDNEAGPDVCVSFRS